MRPEDSVTEVALPTSRFDSTLVPLLAAGVSQSGAAARAGCSESTVRRRMADPSFRLAVAEAHRERRDALLAASVAAAQAATNFLLKVTNGEVRGARMSDRVRAAIALRHGLIDTNRGVL